MARNRAVWDIDMSRVAKNISFVHTFSWKKTFFEKTAQNATKATFFNRSAYFENWPKSLFFDFFLKNDQKSRCVGYLHESSGKKY